MTTQPVVRVIPRLANGPHHSAKDDPEEFLISLLDWVGGRLIPTASCDHIADDLLGCWSLYQLLSFRTPPFGAVRSLEFMAGKMDLQDMRQAAKAAAAAISSAKGQTAKQDVFEENILNVPIPDYGDLASWVEQNIRTVLLPDREAWDRFHQDLDDKLKEHHPSIWRAKRKEQDARLRVAKLFRQQLEVAKKAR